MTIEEDEASMEVGTTTSEGHEAEHALRLEKGQEGSITPKGSNE